MSLADLWRAEAWRPGVRPWGPEARAGVLAPRSGRRLIQVSLIRRCNDLIDCPVGAWQVAVPLRAASAHYARSQPWVRLSPSAWNGSWDDAQNDPSAAGAISEIACAIGAASTCAAREYASCKQLVGEKLHAGAAESHVRRR